MTSRALAATVIKRTISGFVLGPIAFVLAANVDHLARHDGWQASLGVALSLIIFTLAVLFVPVFLTACLLLIVPESRYLPPLMAAVFLITFPLVQLVVFTRASDAMSKPTEEEMVRPVLERIFDPWRATPPEVYWAYGVAAPLAAWIALSRGRSSKCVK